MENDNDVEMNNIIETKKEEYSHISLSNDIQNSNCGSSLKRKLELFDIFEIDHGSPTQPTQPTSPNRNKYTLDLSKCKSSLFINLYNEGYSFSNNNKIYPYNDKDSKIFLDALSHQKLIPELIDILDETLCNYYNGCIVVDIKDFRGTSHSNNTTSNNIEAKRVVLKPDYESILFDLQKESTDSLKTQVNTNSQEVLDDCLLNFERLFLKASNPQLKLANNGLELLYQRNQESYNSGTRYLFDFKRMKSNNYEYIGDNNDFISLPPNSYNHQQYNRVQNSNFTNSGATNTNNLQQPFFKRNSNLPDSIDINNFSLFRLITSNVNLIENDRRNTLQYYSTVFNPKSYPCSYQYQTTNNNSDHNDNNNFEDPYLKNPTKPPQISIVPKLSIAAEQLKSRMFQYISSNNLLVLTYEVRPKGTMYYLYSYVTENFKQAELIRMNHIYQIQMMQYQNTIKQLQIQKAQQQQQQQQTIATAQQQQQSPIPQQQTTPQTINTPQTAVPQQSSPTPQQQPTPGQISTPQTPNVQSPTNTTTTTTPQPTQATLTQPTQPTQPQPPTVSVRICIDGEINFDSEVPKPTCFIYPIGNATQALFFITHLKNCIEKDGGFVLNFDSYLPPHVQQSHTNHSEAIRKRVESKYYPQPQPQPQPINPSTPQGNPQSNPQAVPQPQMTAQQLQNLQYQQQQQQALQYQQQQAVIQHQQQAVIQQQQQAAIQQQQPQTLQQSQTIQNQPIPMNVNIPPNMNAQGVVPMLQGNMVPNYGPNGMAPTPQQIQLQQQQNVQQNVQQIIQQHHHQQQIQNQQLQQQQQIQIQQLQQQKYQQQQQLQNKI